MSRLSTPDADDDTLVEDRLAFLALTSEIDLYCHECPKSRDFLDDNDQELLDRCYKAHLMPTAPSFWWNNDNASLARITLLGNAYPLLRNDKHLQKSKKRLQPSKKWRQCERQRKKVLKAWREDALRLFPELTDGLDQELRQKLSDEADDMIDNDMIDNDMIDDDMVDVDIINNNAIDKITDFDTDEETDEEEEEEEAYVFAMNTRSKKRKLEDVDEMMSKKVKKLTISPPGSPVARSSFNSSQPASTPTRDWERAKPELITPPRSGYNTPIIVISDDEDSDAGDDEDEEDPIPMGRRRRRPVGKPIETLNPSAAYHTSLSISHTHTIAVASIQPAIHASVTAFGERSEKTKRDGSKRQVKKLRKKVKRLSVTVNGLIEETRASSRRLRKLAMIRKVAISRVQKGRPLCPPRGVTDFENWPRADDEALPLPRRTDPDDEFRRKTLALRDAFREGRGLAVWTKYVALRQEIVTLRKLSAGKSSVQEMATTMYAQYLQLMGKWGSALGKELDAVEEGFSMDDLDDFEGEVREEDFEGFDLETCVQPERKRTQQMKPATRNRWEAMPGLIDYVFKTKGATQEHAAWIMTHRPRINELLTHLWKKRSEDKARVKRISLKLKRMSEGPSKREIAGKTISKGLFRPLLDGDGDASVSATRTAAPAYAREPAFDLAAELKTLLKLRLLVKRRWTALEVNAKNDLRRRLREEKRKKEPHRDVINPGPDYQMYKQFHDAISYRYDELVLVGKGKVPPMTPSRRLGAAEKRVLVEERNGRLDHEGFRAASLEEFLGREDYERCVQELRRGGAADYRKAFGSRFDSTEEMKGRPGENFQGKLTDARRAVGKFVKRPKPLQE
ncbi:hypothetical protein CkaCkLH20_09001 [Colletotrichum karsti]|uniref:Uncharacterized protein n=1 Tax=Colletotrichum karsti TaxID=1095194 RepID=A0A9P6LIF0_9PEZI|nr:uncharacterized protein CkaCkLH20_09001 [Colletotrichum karsti]KAF9873542.1 hypothetical protein CkaCkLH20_09001 [Colletotrichum karsti]